MKKKLSLLITFLILAAPALAAVSNQELISAIKKYKTQNYVGCIQDMTSIVKRDPSNVIALYYLAISNANIGRKDPAINAFKKVAGIDSNPTLTQYAMRALICITPDDKSKPDSCVSDETDLDKFINSQSSSFSKDVSRKMQEKDLEEIRNQINRTINQKSDLPQADKKAAAPTNDEIAEAVKTLSRAGVNVFANAQNNYQDISNSMYQSPEYAQLQMLTGSTAKSNDTFSYMMPYLMNQSGNSSNKMSPEMIKTMMMSSLMGDFSLGEEDKNK